MNKTTTTGDTTMSDENEFYVLNDLLHDTPLDCLFDNETELNEDGEREHRSRRNDRLDQSDYGDSVEVRRIKETIATKPEIEFMPELKKENE